MQLREISALVLAAAMAACAGAPTNQGMPAMMSMGSPSRLVATANVASQPPDGIPVRGRCDVTRTEVPVVQRTLLVRVDVGRCHLSHVGSARVDIEQRVNLALGTQTAEYTLTTSDGAQVRLSNVSESARGRSGVRFAGAAKIIGGTGRFLGAAGVMRAEGTTSLDGTNGVLKLDGWIAYATPGPLGSGAGGAR